MPVALEADPVLVSMLLSGDARLQRCAVEDPAHVTEGQKGPHVRLIQLALAITDNADIAGAESTSSSYGPSTTAAVLAYKTKRQIINRSYQSKPDAIVGKMTIASLDAEVAARERRNLAMGAGRPGADITTKRD
jgi:peptidoglycan hydrolase-like protein with peptidoglycan-binding domain